MNICVNGGEVWCKPMTLRQWTNRKRVFVCDTEEYDIFLIGETYYYDEKEKDK